MNDNKITAQTEVVEIIHEAAAVSNNAWHPREGDTALNLKNRALQLGIKEHEWETIKDNAIDILSKCISPYASAKKETGLVIGRVQSGKTLSFTTVAALARDNNYQMIIVIAGTSLNLLGQSTNRLEEDLNLLTRSDRKWQHFKSNEFSDEDYTTIANTLAEWQDPTIPEFERQTILITAMKQHQHLDKLTHILSRIELSDVPTLVIDDEADQASLNTKVQKGGISTTYQRILSLRNYLPHHTFLQYTATPQALLLINLIDVLSPNLVKMLNPGTSYTGGKAFFLDSPDRIRTIPDDEIPTKDNPLGAPPDSLLESMRIFFLGVSAGIILDKSKGNRSMMVHPSRKTIGHKQYYKWIKAIRNNWQKILALEENEKDYQDLLREFRGSYKDLQETVPNLPSFKLLLTRLLHAVRSTELHEVNSTTAKTAGISWNRKYAHILVGGQAMDRGFTVEGITVTYMPRGAGMGNADTIQQRARFFGYKKDYFGYCRVFLENNVRDAFEQYVIHEEDLWGRLDEHNLTGKPLDEWKRVFFLDSRLKPTRQNVLDIECIRVRSKGHWFYLRVPPDTTEALEANQIIINEFCNNLSFQEDAGHPDRSDDLKHHETKVLLRKVYEDLLVPFRVTHPIESQRLTSVILQLDSYLDRYPNTLCTVFRIKKGKSRDRSVGEDKNEIIRLFQGEQKKNGKIIYKGDRSKKESTGVTVQIYNHRLVFQDGKIVEDVPTLAVWLPKGTSPDLLVQPQGAPKNSS